MQTARAQSGNLANLSKGTRPGWWTCLAMFSSDANTSLNRSGTEPLRDQVLQRCRTLLLLGHVVPGQKLPLRPLADEFNTSLMPVRDALNRLVADGALEFSSQRTVRVPHMTSERLIELHEIRRSLEGDAAALAAQDLTEESIGRMEQLMDEMAVALKHKDYDTYLKCHYSFHFTIYGAAKRPTLLGMIDSLWLQIGPWFRNGIEQATDIPGNPNSWHQGIVSALRARDSIAVRASIEADACASIKFLGTEGWSGTKESGA